jgi:hypothetical protein
MCINTSLIVEPHDANPYPLANLGVLSGSSSFSDLHLPAPSTTPMKHQQSFSSLSSGGITPSHTVPTFSFNTFGQIHTPQVSGTNYKSSKYDEPKPHHHHGIFHRHHSPSQTHTTPARQQGLVIDDEEIVLDTDLGKLQGIVANTVPPDFKGRPSGEINPIAPWETSTSPRVHTTVPGGSQSDATWTAPESWGVRPPSQIADELGEFPAEEEVVTSRQTYCLRVFRTDSTFATIPCPANTSVAELLGLLAKKFFVPLGERWVLVLYINNLARVMQSNERPVALQQKGLERLGYVEDMDGGGEMGRDDWSGFWRFVFMRADGLSSIAVCLDGALLTFRRKSSWTNSGMSISMVGTYRQYRCRSIVMPMNSSPSTFLEISLSVSHRTLSIPAHRYKRFDLRIMKRAAFQKASLLLQH